MRLTFVLTLPTVLLIAGCMPIAADGVLEVTGVVADAQGRPFEKCSFELFHSAGGRSILRREINGEFGIHTVGPPRSQDYIVEISCQDARTRFRSAPVSIGGATPTNLGRIKLERM